MERVRGPSRCLEDEENARALCSHLAPSQCPLFLEFTQVSMRSKGLPGGWKRGMAHREESCGRCAKPAYVSSTKSTINFCVEVPIAWVLRFCPIQLPPVSCIQDHIYSSIMEVFCLLGLPTSEVLGSKSADGSRSPGHLKGTSLVKAVLGNHTAPCASPGEATGKIKDSRPPPVAST